MNERTDRINANIALTKASHFTSLSEHGHMLHRPDMYIGSINFQERREWLLMYSVNQETSQYEFKAQETVINIPYGLERIFIEIISNAGDNAERSRRTPEFKDKVGKLIVTMDRSTISVQNGGVPIPIEQDSNGLWIPEKAFGVLRTGTNFDDTEDRSYCGRNGFGAKLTNVFSTRFVVEILNPLSHLKYVQQWNGLQQKSPPVISEYTGTESMVRITYDFNKTYFKLPNGYPDEVFYFFAMHSANIGMLNQMEVVFNNMELKCQNLNQYGSLLLGEEAVSSAVIHYEWPKGTELVKRKGCTVSKNKYDRPIVEMMVVDTPNKGKQISFVNGIHTRDGGEHVNAAYKSITDTVLKFLNGRNTDKKTGKVCAKLTVSEVKRHVTLIMNVRMVNPPWDSQSKARLTSFPISVKPSDHLKKKLLKWQLVECLEAEIMAKYFRASKRTDGRKQRHVKDCQADDANLAGTNRSTECSALLVEGLSAMGYAVNWVSQIEGGRDKFGVFPLRGKPLNARNASLLKVSENKVFTRLKKFLGLREGCDYMNDNNYNTLRYGHIMILTDADQDGDHIKGLVLLYLRCYHPSLLTRGCVYFIRTPILRAVIKDKTYYTFYSIDDYNKWRREDPDASKYTILYFKGLGSSTDKDIAEDVKAPKLVMCIYDDQATGYFELAFNSKWSHQRKEWLAKVQEKLNLVHQPRLELSSLINNELIEYARANNIRSLPDAIDGLKPSQRKALYVALYCSGGKRNSWTTAKIKSASCNKKKVAQFGSGVAAETHYHHGESCLHQTIITMTQDYAGANNMPYFTKEGQFGTRTLLGKNAADPRYIFIKPQQWLVYVFPAEDRPLYDILIEEGDPIEPKTLLPIIPMHLINGAMGIGTAWSTYIPSHDPIEVCDWYINRLTGQPLPNIIPSYNGFTGLIEVVPRNAPTKKTTEEPANCEPEDVNNEETITAESLAADEDLKDDYENDEEGEEFKLGNDDVFIDSKAGALVMKVSGKFEMRGNDLHITELPLGWAINAYKNWLTTLEEQKVFKQFNDYSKPNEPHFVIRGYDNPTLEKLRLIRRFGLSNMVLMKNGIPTRYSGINELLEDFYNLRIGFYGKRKQYELNKIMEDIEVKSELIKFIEAVAVTQTLEVRNRTKKAIQEDMIRLNIKVEIYPKVKLSNCSVDEIEKLKGEIEQLRKNYQELNNTPDAQLWVNDLWKFKQMYLKHYRK